MRRIPIVNIVPSGINPGIIVLDSTADNASGDWTQVFQGKFYRDPLGATQPFYSSPTPPPGYSLIKATTFTVIDNASYAGRYTVFTQPSMMGLPSSEFGAGQTTVRVNENIGAPLSPADATSGYVTNVSTFYITVPPSAPIIIPPEVLIESFSVDLPGRNFSGWGEIFLQNLAKQTQNFAGSTAPTAPFTGQPWYNTTNSEFRIWNGASWELLNGSVFAGANSYKHIQGVSNSTWTVTHGLGVAAPFIVNHSFYVDIGAGVIKPILPDDVTYVNGNQFTVTFSTPYAGYALVRS